MRSGHRTVLVVAASFWLAGQGLAQENDLSRQTLETMRRHVASLRAVSRSAGGEEMLLKRNDTPVLRYSDPGGVTTDASIWVWEERGRPAVMAGIFFQTQEGKEPKWSCELLSLADGGALVSSAAGWKWTPAASDLVWLKLKDQPGDTARQRLRQMKEIAERYEIISHEDTIRSPLRLMPQP